MNVQSYTILHYGKDYLPYALRSIYPLMDRMHIFYTPHPSHGRQTDIQPPEFQNDLRDVAFSYDPDRKISWNYVDKFYYEGNHRDYALEVCRQSGADLVVVLDCDEVWHGPVLSKMINHVIETNRSQPIKTRNWLINFTHLWKSFNWCCRDEGWPVRIIDLRANEGTAYLSKELGGIYHFGYAIRDHLMRYKWKIHGHFGELRQGWLDGKWQECPSYDCHPTNDKNFWDCQPFNKSELPELMRHHPFYNLERID